MDVSYSMRLQAAILWVFLPKPPNWYISASWDMTSHRAKPEQGGTASNVDFLKVITTTVFGPFQSFPILEKSKKRTFNAADDAPGKTHSGFPGRRPSPCYASTVGLTPMTNDHYIYQTLVVIDGVHNSVLTDAYPPETSGTLQLCASFGPRLLLQHLNSRQDARRNSAR
jgi:hypothetical protein